MTEADAQITRWWGSVDACVCSDRIGDATASFGDLRLNFPTCTRIQLYHSTTLSFFFSLSLFPVSLAPIQQQLLSQYTHGFRHPDHLSFIIDRVLGPQLLQEHCKGFPR